VNENVGTGSAITDGIIGNWSLRERARLHRSPASVTSAANVATGVDVDVVFALRDPTTRSLSHLAMAYEMAGLAYVLVFVILCHFMSSFGHYCG
jgi:hypothetical protein